MKRVSRGSRFQFLQALNPALSSRVLPQFLPRFLAAALLLAGCAVVLTPAEHYRSNQDGRSLFTVLREDIRNGDSRDKVQQVLGAKAYDSATHREGALTAARMTPGDFPDGLKDTDAVVFYPYDDRGLVTLVFRDGKLINHNPARYPALKDERSVKY